MNSITRGDCIEVMKAMPARSVDFVATDPPYLVRYCDRSGRTVKNDNNDAWIDPAFAQIHRVLKPGGEARVMVYNLESANAYTTIVRDYLVGFWRGKSLDQCLWQRADGYMARYYTRDVLSDIFRIFFDDVAVESFGQDADAVPLPRLLRRPILRLVPEQKLKDWANRRGFFLFVTAKNRSA